MADPTDCNDTREPELENLLIELLSDEHHRYLVEGNSEIIDLAVDQMSLTHTPSASASTRSVSSRDRSLTGSAMSISCFHNRDRSRASSAMSLCPSPFFQNAMHLPGQLNSQPSFSTGAHGAPELNIFGTRVLPRSADGPHAPDANKSDAGGDAELEDFMADIFNEEPPPYGHLRSRPSFSAGAHGAPELNIFGTRVLPRSADGPHAPDANKSDAGGDAELEDFMADFLNEEQSEHCIASLVGDVMHESNGRAEGSNLSHQNTAMLMNTVLHAAVDRAEGRRNLINPTMDRNGLIIAKPRGCSRHCVTKINANHPVIALFPTLREKCIVLSINQLNINHMTNSAVSAYLRNNTIMTIEFETEDVAKRNRESIHVEQRRAQRYLRKVNATPRITLEWNKLCKYGCGFTHLSNSTRRELLLCCRGGSMRNTDTYYLKPLPAPVLTLFENHLPHVSRASSIYNNLLAPVATGVENTRGGGFESILGDHCVKLMGRTFHCSARSSRSSDPSGNISYFTMDNHQSVHHPTDAGSTSESITGPANGYIQNGTVYDSVRPSVLSAITDQLARLNKYFTPTALAVTTNVPTMTATMQLDPEYHEVAQVTAISPAGNRILTVRGGERIITMDSAEVEPLCYPLLFFHGENGWGSEHRETTFPHYLASRMLMPDVIDDRGTVMTMPAHLRSANDERRIVCNRFSLLSRVGQVYICDQLSRSIDFRLDWIKNNQNIIFGGTERGVKSTSALCNSDSEGSDNDISDDESGNPGERDFLPSSFFASKRYLKKKALNALAVLSEFGKATFFLTMTCNTNWPEIQEILLREQTAYARQSETCMVFKKRLEKFLSMLEAGELFPLRGCKVEYIMRTIEFQHRGLPHAHIVFKLVDAPDDETLPEDVAKFVDTFISAEMPTVTPNSSTVQEDTRYLELVRTHNIHRCIVSPGGCKKTESCPCKRGYSDSSDHVPLTCFSDLGYPIYRRRHDNDRRVVPHSRPMIMAWDGHLNLEYAAGVKCALYLYSYLYKGPKSVGVDITSAEPLLNESSLYLKGRFICAMDACWRIFGYQTYPASKPRVRVIKVKTPDMVSYVLGRSRFCDMAIYFNRPASLADLKYADMFKMYTVGSTLPARYKNKAELLNIDYFEVTLESKRGHTISTYIFKRSTQLALPVTRMEMLYVLAGDIWFLRLILQKEAPVSFQEAISHNNVQYASYQQAAIAKGYVEDGEEVVTNFTELIPCYTPRELRSLFCTMLIYGFPMRIVYDNETMRLAMMSDYLTNAAKKDVDVAVNMMLLDFKRNLELGNGKRLKDYGFDEPPDTDNEVEREKALINKTVEEARYNELCLLTPNNPEQETVFKTIVDAVELSPGLIKPLTASQFFFVSGPGGVGKSEVCKKLHAYFRSKKYLIKICASTTLAATLFPRAETAHSAFKFPVVDDDDADAEERVETNLDKFRDRLDFFHECKVIFWDEFVSNHKQLFEAVLRKFKDNNIRLVFVCCGDFRQILPVVKHGNMQDTVSATISSSLHWEQFQILHLRQNMRLLALQTNLTAESSEDEQNEYHTQSRYNNSIMAIAGGPQSIRALNESGSHNSDCYVFSEDPNTFSARVALRGVKVHTEEETREALKFLYPNGFEPETATTNCVLAATNKAGNTWNALIQDLNPEVSKNYPSHDKLSEVDDEKGILKSLLKENLLQTITVSGVPSYHLNLKVNDICLVLRSLLPLGLATNQRVRILKFYRKCIQVETLQDRRVVIIPRIRFNFNLRYGDSYRVMRTQFPLRLAYCMTYNKAQGQTLGKVLLDTTEEPFAHGQCYVALSRVRSKHDIRIFSLENNILHEGNTRVPVITNVVYPQVLLQELL